VSFPEHIAAVLDAYRVPADTKAALYDLYVSMGNDVLEVFGDISETVADASTLRPEDTTAIRNRVVERYLRRNHPHWLEGKPTASLWHPRVTEGRASGLAMPLGDLPDRVRGVVAAGQPVPDGILMLGRNAHYGGRQETISFDVVAPDLGDAIALGQAAGQQHTLPGSVGETSGTFDGEQNLALIWEVQPNVYKPAGDRNRAIRKIHGRHRNWHIVTLAAALEWLRERRCSTYILRGEALATTHEVNPQKPVTQTIIDLHNRTVQQVCDALGLTLVEVTDDDGFLLLASVAMNHALRKYVLQEGAAGLMWRVSLFSAEC
jgi:hypothetical protein